MKVLIKARTPILLFVAVLLSELLLWNLSAVISMFYQEITPEPQNWEGRAIRQEDGSYLLPDGQLTVTLSGIHEKVHNLHLDVVPLPYAEDVGSAQSVSYEISLSDEGNYYPYELPVGIIVEGIRATEYTDIHAAGEVKDVHVTFSAPANTVVGNLAVKANVRLPFVISIPRIVLAYLLLMVGWLLLSGRALMPAGRNLGKGQMVAVIVLLALLMIGCYRLAVLNPVHVKPPWPHHRQYQELAELLLKGKVALEEKPSLKLVESMNPYDTIWLQAQGIEYKADYAYHEDNYFVYFGIVPELLLYLPFQVIMGFPLPNYMAVFLLFSGFMVMVFALFREIIRSFFPDTPFLIWLMVALMTVFVGSHAYLMAEPDMYKVPISAALMFTAAGLWFWFKALRADGVRGRLLLAMGSFCMALVAGCRPQMILYSGLGILVFREKKLFALGKDFFSRKKENFSLKAVGDVLAFSLPYLVVGAGVMYYNWIRFGSVLDFGAAYSLTSNDMTKRGFDIEQTLQGLYYYFMQLPLLDTVFPFLHRNPVETAYMGKLNAEYVYGGLLASNAFIWFVGFLPVVGKRLREKGLSIFVWTALSVSVAVAVIDTNLAGILQRYMADFTWGFGLAAGVAALAWAEQMAERKHTALPKVFMGIFVLQGLFSLALIFGGGDAAFGLQNMAPQVFYRIYSWF